jgi:hypothetical protein
MTLEDYMKIKFPKSKTKALTSYESKTLGIPLVSGWFSENKDMEIPPSKLKKLVEYNTESKRVSSVRKARFRAIKTEYVEWEGQYLYLMKNEIGRFKIGISEDPVKRAWGITGASGILTKLIAFWKVSVAARDVESAILKKFKNYRTYGEWFDLETMSPEIIESFITDLCDFERQQVFYQN